MITDIILVAVGIILFTVLTAMQKEHFSQLKDEFALWFGKNAILSGILVSLLKLIILISQFESEIGTNTDSLQFADFIIIFFVRFRPLLLGLVINVLCIPFEKKTNSSVGTSKGTTGTVLKVELLSPREKEVARLAARGYSNAQIADELFISAETVKRHMATIFEKLEIKSRIELKEIL